MYTLYIGINAKQILYNLNNPHRMPIIIRIGDIKIIILYFITLISNIHS